MRLLLPVPSGMTSGFRLLGALCVQYKGMPSLRCLTLTPGGLWISSFFQPKVTHVDQRPCPCKPWKEVRECTAWQPCLGLLRADTGQSLCDFSSSFICLYLDSCLFYESLLGKSHVFEVLVCLQQISQRMGWVPGVMGKLQSGRGPSTGGVLAEKTSWSLPSLYRPDTASCRTFTLNRFTHWKEGAELNDFLHPWSIAVYWHFLCR